MTYRIDKFIVRDSEVLAAALCAVLFSKHRGCIPTLSEIILASFCSKFKNIFFQKWLIFNFNLQF